MACELLEFGFTFLYVNKSNCLREKEVFFSIATNALNCRLGLVLFLFFFVWGGGKREGTFQKML